MLKARWSGYEIDSSEAAYEIEVQRPEELGTLVRSFLTSGYFTRSYYSLFEEPLEHLRDFIKGQGDLKDALTTKALEQLDKQIAKFDPDDWRAPRIGVQAIESILNYVGAHRQALLDAQVFRFELTDEQKEIYEDYEYEFETGQKVDESVFYSETEIPFDGTVLYLGCYFVKASQLSPAERKEARRIARKAGKRMDQFGELDIFGGNWAEMFEDDLERSMNVTLRVRLNPDATFSITGRWMEDGQFLYDYYAYLLDKAAEKAQVQIGSYVL